jgi:hypothetical protein
MRLSGQRLRIVGRGCFLLSPLLLGGCFYSPSTSLGSSQSNLPPPVVLYGQSDDAAPSSPETTNTVPDKRARSTVARAKAISPASDSADEWPAENQAEGIDDAALKKKLVICSDCLTKPTRRQKQEAAEQAGSSGW